MRTTISKPRKQCNPHELRAIAILKAEGMAHDEIRLALGISRATLYRRLSEIEALRESCDGGADDHDDHDDPADGEPR